MEKTEPEKKRAPGPSTDTCSAVCGLVSKSTGVVGEEFRRREFAKTFRRRGKHKRFDVEGILTVETFSECLTVETFFTVETFSAITDTWKRFVSFPDTDTWKRSGKT